MIKEVERGNTHVETIGFTMEMCINCGMPFFMPTCHYKRLLANKGETFYCPNGHGQHYAGKTEAEKLKERLEQLEIEKNKREQELQDKWLDALSEKQKIENKLKRVQNGVCPCCNRSFHNLQQHIQNEHPELMDTQEKAKRNIATRKKERKRIIN
jgi:hypothetical protein